MSPTLPRSFRRAALGAAFALCAAGGAGAQSRDVIFHANLDEYAGYSDVWGYTAPGGEEYALLGTWSGVSVVNVTDPTGPYETGFFPGAYSTWRDLKTYQQHAYITNESSGGLMILDLTDPENPLQRPTYTGFSTAHNLFIDQATGLCYIAGSNLSTGGLRILSLQDPVNPVEVGSWEDLYLHDVVVNAGRAFVSAIYNRRLLILDVTDPAAIPPPLGVVQGYPSAFTHNADVTADNHYVMTTDETTGASVRLWDVSNPAAPVQTSAFRPNPGGTPHNVHIEGNLAFVSHYTAGVRIADLSNPAAVTELGYYDTYPVGNGSTLDGCWGVFPFFGSTPSLFVASDIQSGLFVLEYRGPLGQVTGHVTEAGTAFPVPGARLEVAETGLAVSADAAGIYTLSETAGPRTLQVSAFGFQPATVPVDVTVGAVQTVDIALTPLPGGSIAGTVLDAGTALPVPGAAVELLATPLAQASDASGQYEYRVVPTGTYTVQATSFGQDRVQVEVVVQDGSALNVPIALPPALLADAFEAAAPGWTVTGNAITGAWQRADPEGTYEDGQAVQPENDHTAAGVSAWVTGPLAGSVLGQYDVDGGETVLTSPVLDLSLAASPRVTYRRWYSTGLGNPTTDFFTVEVSSDAGASWVTVESTDQRRTEWLLVDRAIDDYVPPGPQIQFRFTARDTGVGSITEAAIDDFSVYETHGMIGATTVAGGAGPGRLRLSAPFPNPVRGADPARLALVLPARQRVRAAVFDVSGRRIATVADEVLPAGPHQLVWDGRSSDGRPASGGVYFLRLDSRGVRESRKVVLVR